MRLISGLFVVIFWAVVMPSMAQESPSADDLARQMSESLRDGDSATRLRLKIKEGEEEMVMQVQVKARRGEGKTEIMYQVLYPKDHKGRAFLLQREGESAAKGVVYTPPQTLNNLDGEEMHGDMLGSDLSYQDIIENFFSWEKHSMAGKEVVDRVECLVLESEPGSKDVTAYSRVKSWIDPKRMVVLKVEKYGSDNKLARTIETTGVFKDTNRRYVPSSMIIRRPDSKTLTEIQGSNLRHDLKFKDSDFTVKSLNDYRLPRPR